MFDDCHLKVVVNEGRGGFEFQSPALLDRGLQSRHDLSLEVLAESNDRFLHARLQSAFLPEWKGESDFSGRPAPCADHEVYTYLPESKVKVKYPRLIGVNLPPRH